MTDTQPRRLEDFGQLTDAEQQVLDELDTGEVIRLGPDVPNADASDDRFLRARFLRWVILGCAGSEAHRLHEKGVLIQGALITGEGADHLAHGALDLRGAEVWCDLVFIDCHLTAPPNLMGARMQGVYLDRSHLPGLLADRLETRGSVHLLSAKASREITLRGARINGDLACDGATLSGTSNLALNADRLETGGGVFLRDAQVSGEIRLLGALIGGTLECDRAKLTNLHGRALYADGMVARDVFLRSAAVSGQVRLTGARIRGNLECDGASLSSASGIALRADSAHVTGNFFLRPDKAGKDADIRGQVDLSAAEFGTVNDAPSSWPKGGGSLFLDRCRYGAFTGGGVSAAERLRWLALQEPADYDQGFWPQPYEECARVFREMGHAEDAKEILIEKERLQRADRRGRAAWYWRWWPWFWDRFLGVTVRYGQRPLFALWWLGGLWVIGAVVFWLTWEAQQFKPNNAFVLRAPEWVGCSVNARPYAFRRERTTSSQLGCFRAQPEAEGFPEFDALIYSFDVLFPLVQVEQQAHWIPDEDQWFGRWAKRLVYVEIIMGWMLSLLAVAGLSGIIKSD